LIEPAIDLESEAYWDAINHDSLVLQRCSECGKARFHSMPSCPYCGAEQWERYVASGRGHVYSWVVVQRAMIPDYVDDVPYTILTVQLDEGPRLFGRLIETDSVPVAGMRVAAAYYTVRGRRLVGFVLDTTPA
jgi:uncharacterized OB-fold protein